MKYLLFDFRCQQCTSRFEHMVKPDVYEAPCPKCGGTATRLVAAPRIDPRMGVSSSFPTMADRWAKVRVQRKIIEERRAAEHGPDSWGSAGADVIR